MYRALYRKWRPQRVEDVVAQRGIVTALRNQIATGRVGHAYLFTGVRGTGKTTCAKIFAKAVNCLHPQNGDPCGECEICRGIDNGSILDVVEMDAASNNGADDIREQRDETAYTPSACHYKVYIIDEVHMLSTAAFNALLKTLEDPGQLETWRQEVQAKVDALRQELREAALRISGSVNQRLEELNRDVTEKLQTLQSVFDSVSGNLSALGDKLTRYQEAIQSTGTTLSGAIQLSSPLRGDQGQLAQDMDRSVTSDGFRRFVEVLENDPEGLADYLSDPVSMETVPVYEITSPGSSMAPYYIMLALFVVSLLTTSMLHVNAPMPGLSRLRPWQRFFGRYQLFFLIGMIQALVTGRGCIYYIGIQCPYPGLFLLACCVCSLNFTMMNYALVYALDNIGMAASVIIMVIQVAGSGGVYPIDVLPGIFQTLYKFMPFHYGMDMLRETIAGRYENVYWKNLAVMAAMCVLIAVMGKVLY